MKKVFWYCFYTLVGIIALPLGIVLVVFGLLHDAGEKTAIAFMKIFLTGKAAK